MKNIIAISLLIIIFSSSCTKENKWSCTPYNDTIITVPGNSLLDEKLYHTEATYISPPLNANDEYSYVIAHKFDTSWTIQNGTIYLVDTGINCN